MKKYESERNNRVLVVCEKKKTQESVIRRLAADETIRMYKDYFLFKDLAVIEKGNKEYFGKDWQNGVGEIVAIW